MIQQINYSDPLTSNLLAERVPLKCLGGGGPDTNQDPTLLEMDDHYPHDETEHLTGKFLRA